MEGRNQDIDNENNSELYFYIIPYSHHTLDQNTWEIKDEKRYRVSLPDEKKKIRDYAFSISEKHLYVIKEEIKIIQLYMPKNEFIKMIKNRDTLVAEKDKNDILAENKKYKPKTLKDLAMKKVINNPSFFTTNDTLTEKTNEKIPTDLKIKIENKKQKLNK